MTRCRTPALGRHVVRAMLLLGAVTGVASAQKGAPLLKTDLIELLTSPVIPHQEIADLVRRNCLAFRPTERDWTDFRSLGASPDVVASINGCATTPRPAPVAAPRPVPPAGAPAPAAATPLSPAPVTATGLQVMLRQPRVQAAAGSQVRIVVIAARAGLPQAGAQLVLLGSAGIEGGSGHDVVAATDDSGFAVFPVRVGRRVGSYHLEVASATGGALPGRPVIELFVHPGPPASAKVTPGEVVFDQGLDSIVPVEVLIRDSIGHLVAGEPVVLEADPDGTGVPSDTARTDSLGRARLIVAGAGARRSGTLQITVHGRQMAWVDVVVGASLLESATGFLPNQTLRGIVHHTLGASLVFGARTRLGRPAAGRTVSFRAVNASVAPATATTDSEGRAQVEVTLGDRAGWAVIVARVDSIEKMTSVRIEPGPPTQLELEYNGAAVNGRWLVVKQDTTFVVRVRSRDQYGNPTGVAALARMLRTTPFNTTISIARLLNVEEEEASVALTFKAGQPGRAIVKLSIEDIAASLSLEVARRP